MDKALVFVCILITMLREVQGGKTSPLRLGSDSVNNDFSLVYLQQYTNYLLEFSASTDYMQQ